MSIQFKQTTLANGLEIIAEVDPQAHTSAMGFFVKTGARDEDRPVMGVSHFLEHMMFKGTDRRSAEDVDRDFDGIGADHNAFTTSELTAFYAHCLPERLPEASEILADILRPALRDDDFNQEKKVILEEIAMYRDHPFWVLYERAMEVYYGSHPLGYRVLGLPETVTDMTREQMQAYFDHRYSADNTVVTLAGRMDFDRVVVDIESHCGHWQRTRVTRSYAPTRFAPHSFSEVSSTANQHYLLALSPGPSLADDRRYAAAMLMQILGDSEGSRLYRALIETGLADEVQCSTTAVTGWGRCSSTAAAHPIGRRKSRRSYTARSTPWSIP